MFDKRFVFHVPEFYIDGSGALSCDNSAFVEELQKQLRTIIPNNMFTNRGKCIIGGIEVSEMCIYFYTDSNMDTKAAKIFEELICKYHNDLRQDGYLYEVDDIEIHIKIGGED